jgi:hypothetical protein
MNEYFDFIKQFIAMKLHIYNQNNSVINPDMFFSNNKSLFEYCFHIKTKLANEYTNENTNENNMAIYSGNEPKSLQSDMDASNCDISNINCNIQQNQPNHIEKHYYKIKTFQEYVDDNYNLQILGPYDYSRFFEMMRDPTFKKSLSVQYKTNMEKLKFKNEIIFIAENKLPDYLDIIPYYQYKSNNKYREIATKKFIEYENMTFQEIDEFFGVATIYTANDASPDNS